MGSLRGYSPRNPRSILFTPRLRDSSAGPDLTGRHTTGGLLGPGLRGGTRATTSAGILATGVRLVSRPGSTTF